MLLTSLVNISSVTTSPVCLGVSIPLLIHPLALPSCRDLSKICTEFITTATKAHHCCSWSTLQRTESDKDMAWACLLGPLCPSLPSTWDSSNVKLPVASYATGLPALAACLELEAQFPSSICTMLPSAQASSLTFLAPLCAPSSTMMICIYYSPVLTPSPDWELNRECGLHLLIFSTPRACFCQNIHSVHDK